MHKIGDCATLPDLIRTRPPSSGLLLQPLRSFPRTFLRAARTSITPRFVRLSVSGFGLPVRHLENGAEKPLSVPLLFVSSNRSGTPPQTAPRRLLIAIACQGAHLMKTMQSKSIEVGRFLVSPMTKPHADGGFAAAVSIRSGRGMASIDRVMRFVPAFETRRAALRYAVTEGTAWARGH